jgi:hypothetical protein
MEQKGDIWPHEARDPLQSLWGTPEHLSSLFLSLWIPATLLPIQATSECVHVCVYCISQDRALLPSCIETHRSLSSQHLHGALCDLLK